MKVYSQLLSWPSTSSVSKWICSRSVLAHLFYSRHQLHQTASQVVVARTYFDVGRRIKGCDEEVARKLYFPQDAADQG